MQHRSRLLVRTVCRNIGINAATSVSAPSYYLPSFGCIRSLSLSRASRAAHEPSTSTSSTAQLGDTPLKIDSASGDTPPPEDSEARDQEPARPDDTHPSFPRAAGSDSFARPTARARGRPRGSSSRRSLKPQRPRKPAIFKPNIPEWFIARNVTLFNDIERFPFPAQQAGTSDESQSVLPSRNDDNTASSSNQRSRIAVSPYIRKELESHLSAALLIQPGGPRDNLAARKAHIHLQCPKRGAIYFLDELVESVAKDLEADIVRLDGQDLDELLETLIDPSSPEVGFSQPHIFITNIMKDISRDAEQKEEENAEEENEEVHEGEDPSDEAEFRLPPDMPTRLFRLLAPRPMYSSIMNPSPTAFSSSSRSSPPKDDNETKVSAYLDLLISAPSDKRKLLIKKNIQPTREAPTSQIFLQDSRTIIYLRDLRSILETPRGQVVVHALLNVIHNRRRLGEKIVMVVSDDLSGDAVSNSMFSYQYYHTIGILPPTSDAENAVLQEDKDARTREVNLRGIQSAIRQRSRIPSMDFECPVGIHLDTAATSSIPDLGQGIWDVNKIQRIVSIAMGNHGKWLVEHMPQHTVPITLLDIAQAVQDILKADQERSQRKHEKKAAREVENPPQTGKDVKPEASRFPPINSKDFNKHEQKLLGGVIDPEKIQVGFSDIRAPNSAIETLKTLVSLPLKRPDAFSYGVLSKNFINGVLLFGPPGTGKTMLAKAVAKESGARMLEIKGSEVYDMYVGEGEKNVKAIFSLARKLSPCVVFLDEVDTIFSSRNASERHVSHREIINQFMAEWDGINSLNSGILILGATNRPFDLDDAILRRMPRRILVDLPTDEDRLAILKLLLVEELLDPAIDLASLAKTTNLYSGSDLKNVCVSAAVTAVTEEKPSIEVLTDVDGNSSLAQENVGDVEAMGRRVLLPRHFEKALVEVTPSISESMETIELLRKFDKQYGNAKDKKKKLMGFGTDAPEAVANVRVISP